MYLYRKTYPKSKQRLLSILQSGKSFVLRLPLSRTAAFFLLKGSAGTNLASVVMIAVMLPCFLFAMYEKHGQPLEVVVKHVIQTKYCPQRSDLQTPKIYTLYWNSRENLEKEVSAIAKGTYKKGSGKEARLTSPASSPASRKNRLPKLSDRLKATAKPTPRSRQFLILPCTRTVSARLRKRNIQSASRSRTLIISLHRQTIRPPFLKTGAISSIILTQA